jgi:hypothetical protein
LRLVIVVDAFDAILANETAALAETLAAVGHQVTLLSTSSRPSEAFPTFAHQRIQLVEPWARSLWRGLPRFVQMMQDLRPDVVHFYSPRGLRNGVLVQLICGACALHSPRLFATFKEAPSALMRALVPQLRGIFVPYRSLAQEFSTWNQHPAIWVLPTLLQSPPRRSLARPPKTLVIPASPQEIDHFEILLSEIGYALRAHPDWTVCILDPLDELIGAKRRDCQHRLRAVNLLHRTTLLTGSNWATQIRIGAEAGVLCVAPLGLSSRLWEPMMNLALQNQTPALVNSLQAQLSYYHWPEASDFLTERAHGHLAHRLHGLLNKTDLLETWHKTAVDITLKSIDPTNALLRIYSEMGF